jgi:methylglyoxal reductase
MLQRPLGEADLRVSVVTFGAMGFGAPGEAEDARRADVIRAALDAGVSAIDTAPLYGFGRSERVVGRAIRDLRPRPLVLTKVGLRWDDPSEHGAPLFRTRGEGGEELVVRRDSRPESILLEIERSLERLGVERLDLVQVHQRDRRVPIDETMAALRDAVRAGTVRHVGVSNYTAAEVDEARAALCDVPLASVQSQLSLLVRDAERDGLSAARRVRAGFLAYSPLAQGLLSGGYGPDRPLAESDWRAELPLFSKRSRTAIAAALREAVGPIAARHGATISQIALAWVLSREGVSAAIAGASSESQARQNAQAARITLAPSEIAELESTFARLRVDRAPKRRTRIAARLGSLVRRAFVRPR